MLHMGQERLCKVIPGSLSAAEWILEVRDARMHEVNRHPPIAPRKKLIGSL